MKSKIAFAGSPVYPEDRAARLILVRHGATALNGTGDDDSPERVRGWSDPPLTAQGLKDAQRIAKEIAGKFKVTKIFTSDLKRAALTADTIGKAVGVKPRKNRALRPWNLGHLTGKKTKDVEGEMRAYVEKPDAVVPGGEALVQFEQRLMPLFKKIISSAQGDVVIVTHTRDVRAILGWIKAGEGATVDRSYLMSEKDPIQTAGWMALEKKGGKWVDTKGEDNAMAKSQLIFKSEDQYERCGECGHPRGNHHQTSQGGFCAECHQTRPGATFGDVYHEFAPKPGITGSTGPSRLNPVPLSRVARAPHPSSSDIFAHNTHLLGALEEMRSRFHGRPHERTATTVDAATGATSLDDLRARHYGTATDKTNKSMRKSQRVWRP